MVTAQAIQLRSIMFPKCEHEIPDGWAFIICPDCLKVAGNNGPTRPNSREDKTMTPTEFEEKISIPKKRVRRSKANATTTRSGLAK